MSRRVVHGPVSKTTVACVPFYKYHGILAGFAAYKNHVSFGLCAVLQNKNRKMLEEKGCKTGKQTIQIKFDQNVPSTAIKQILKAKMNEDKTIK